MNSMGTDAKGKTAAFFDIQTDDGIIIRGFRIVNGSNGLFISPPDGKAKNGNYYDKVTLPKELKDELEKLAFEGLKKYK